MRNREIGLGRVTVRGITFNDLYYSCHTAIKNQWFERARSYGEWVVLVMFTPSNMDMILIIDPVNKVKEVCNRIQPIKVSREELDRYFNNIQKLKEAHFQQCKLKRKAYKSYRGSSTVEGTH